MMQSKQKQYFTVFPPSNEDKFARYRMVGYSFQGYATFGGMLAFVKRYGANEVGDEYQKILKITEYDFDKNQFWIGA